MVKDRFMTALTRTKLCSLFLEYIKVQGVEFFKFRKIKMLHAFYTVILSYAL